MKRKLFSKVLYMEALRQLRLPGIATFAIVFFCSILIPLQYIVDDFQISYYGNEGINIGNIAPIVGLFMFVGPILFTILLFYFMNKRNACDFYHSIPHSKISLFFSYIAAILTVLYSTIIVTVLSCELLFFVAEAQLSGNYLIYTILTYSAGATLITAATAIGMCLTGTLFSNLLATSLVLFFPRIIFYRLSFTILNCVPIIKQADMSIIGKTEYNIPLNFFFKSIINKDYFWDGSFAFVGGILYTFLLSFIYIAIGSMLYKHRKSETAEKSAPTKVMLNILRCFVIFPFTVGITIMLLLDANPIESIKENIIEYILLLTISLLVLCIFEVITQKKFPDVIKATQVILCLIALNIVFALTVYANKVLILWYSPDAEEIEWVIISETRKCMTENGNQSSIYFSLSEDYDALKLKGVRIEDEKVNKIIAESLDNSIYMIKNQKTDYKYVTYKDNGYSSDTYYIALVTIKSKGGAAKNRLLYISQEQYYELVGVFMSNNEYITEKSVEFSFHKNDFIDQNNTQKPIIEDMDKVYSMFIKEFDKLSTKQKDVLINKNKFYQEDELVVEKLFNLMIKSNIGVELLGSGFFITSLTPNTYEYVLNEVNNRCGGVALKMLALPIQDKIDSYGFSVRSNKLFGEEGLFLSEFANITKTKDPNYRESVRLIFDIILNASKKKLDINKPIILFATRDKNDQTSGILYVNITKSEYTRIRELQINLQ